LRKREKNTKAAMSKRAQDEEEIVQDTDEEQQGEDVHAI